MNSKMHAQYYTEETVVRLIAAQVIILTQIAIISHWVVPMLVLTADFSIRAFTTRTSPLAALAKAIAALLKVNPKPVFVAPKKFAALLGMVFSLSIAVLLWLQYYRAAYAVGGVLILCAVLESIFKICLGCYVYDWFVAPIINRSNNKTRNNNHD
ncbi:DUF4395 domain-containing protein [Taibaiella sp. KBW10]|uniref:DUF4395 domain-containing protein n=1 Tax=Taibaiella sp. KBW10 TaxID=2153357 RepID=UPI000F5B088A|nr:DUF4395 domain-containing protein [Taibaiella sp. KBW10]RQO32569.1 DUF4395 domain-containing protein [Taibaiella sp. KBW10]